MTDSESTTGGTLGKVVGRVKALAGTLTGDEALKREGNLQQAQVEAEQRSEEMAAAAKLEREQAANDEQRAEAETERTRLRTELEAAAREERIEQRESERERQIATQASLEKVEAARRADLKARAADATEHAALHRREVDAAEAARLERQADQAERVADAIDPEAS